MKQQKSISKQNKKYFRIIWHAALLFILLAGILTACAPGETSANLQKETSTIEITETIEPTPTEIPPDIDLTWDWIDFEGYFRMTPKAKQMEENFKPEKGKSKYIIFGKDSPRMFDGDNTVPISEEDLENGDVMNKTNDLLKLELDETGKEILKQMFLYKVDWSQSRKDQDITMYVYVMDGCVYEKSGPLSIIWQDGTVEVFKEEDIPWDKIPYDVWDDIAAGNTRIDLSGDEAICSCNINGIRVSSAEE